MSAYTHPVSRAIPDAVRQLAALAGVCTVAFLVPYVGVSVLGLQHDLSYLVYVVLTTALVAAYARAERVGLGGIVGRRRRRREEGGG